MYDMPVGLHRRRYEYSQARPTLPATAVNTANRGRTWQTDNDTHTESKNSAVGFRGCVRVYIYNPVVVLAFSIFFFEILNRTTEMNWPNAVASDAILALFCCCCLYSLIRNSTLFVSKKRPVMQSSSSQVSLLWWNLRYGGVIQYGPICAA